MRKQENSKLQQIIQTGRELFFKFGIKRVTVQEICEKAEVSKMTFYKHFNNKIDLVKCILGKMFAEGLENYNAIMAQDIPYSKKVELMIQLKLDLADKISPEFFEDYLVRPDSEIFAFIIQKKKENLGMFLRDLVEAQKRGDVRKDIRPEFITFMMDHITEMASDERLVKMFKTPKELIAELNKYFFYGILPRDDK
jgi:AcrR family transcriptional regulator